MFPLIWFIFNEHYKNVLPEDSIGFVIFFVPARKEIKRLNITITLLWTGITTRAMAQVLGKSSSDFKSLRNSTNYYYEAVRWRLTLRKQSLQNLKPSRRKLRIILKIRSPSIRINVTKKIYHWLKKSWT